MRAVWLGFRLLRPRDGRSAVRIVLMGMGAMFGVTAVLGVLSIPSVVLAQADRLGAQEVVWNQEPGALPGYTTPLGARFWGQTSNRWIPSAQRSLVVHSVGAVPSGTPIPLWLDRYPEPGEIAVSPELAEHLGNDPGGFGRRFPQEIIQILPDEILVSPDQLFAVVGVGVDPLAPQNSGVFPVKQLGGDEANYQGPGFRAVRVMVVMGAIFVLLPMLVFVATSARLSARTRQRRLAALRIIGMTTPQAAAVAAFEVAFASFAGALVGVVLWRALIPLSEKVGLGPLRWFASDVSVPFNNIVVLVVGVVLLSTVVALSGSLRAFSNPLQERASAGPSASVGLRRLRVLPLGVGIALLVWAAAAPTETNVWFMIFAAGNIAVGIGVYTFLPVLTSTLGRRLAKRAHSPAMRIAGRRLSHDPAAAARVVVGVLTLVLIVGFGQMLMVVIEWGATRNDPSPDAGTLQSVSILYADADTESIRSIDGVNLAFPIVGSLTRGSSVLIASCSEMKQIAAVSSENCDDNKLQPLNRSGDSEAIHDLIPDIALADRFDFETNGSSRPDAHYRIHPDLLPRTIDVPHSWYIELNQDKESFVNTIVGMSPTADIRETAIHDRGRQASTYGALINTATIVALLLSLGATLTVLTDRCLERRRTSNQLLALGLAPTTLRKTEAIWVATPLASGLTIAVLLALFSGFSGLRLTGEWLAVPTQEIATVVIIGATCAAATALTAILATPTRLSHHIQSDA